MEEGATQFVTVRHKGKNSFSSCSINKTNIMVIFWDVPTLFLLKKLIKLRRRIFPNNAAAIPPQKIFFCMFGVSSFFSFFRVSLLGKIGHACFHPPPPSSVFPKAQFLITREKREGKKLGKLVVLVPKEKHQWTCQISQLIGICFFPNRE